MPRIRLPDGVVLPPLLLRRRRLAGAAAATLGWRGLVAGSVRGGLGLADLRRGGITEHPLEEALLCLWILLFRLGLSGLGLEQLLRLGCAVDGS